MKTEHKIIQECVQAVKDLKIKHAGGDAGPGWHHNRTLDDAIKAIQGVSTREIQRAADRQLIEQCAKIADPWPGFILNDDSSEVDCAVVGCRREIAAAIRCIPANSPEIKEPR